METNVKSDADISKDKVILNEFLDCNLDDYIKGDIGDIPISPTLLNNGSDPLSEENLNKSLDLVNDIRLSCSQKSIWLYTGYKVVGIIDGFWGVEPNVITNKILDPDKLVKGINDAKKRSDIISKCDVLIDGQYIDSQRDISLPYRGSKNQRLIDIQKSLQKGEIVLWQT